MFCTQTGAWTCVRGGTSPILWGGPCTAKRGRPQKISSMWQECVQERQLCWSEGGQGWPEQGCWELQPPRNPSPGLTGEPPTCPARGSPSPRAMAWGGFCCTLGRGPPWNMGPPLGTPRAARRGYGVPWACNPHPWLPGLPGAPQQLRPPTCPSPLSLLPSALSLGPLPPGPWT